MTCIQKILLDMVLLLSVCLSYVAASVCTELNHSLLLMHDKVRLFIFFFLYLYVDLAGMLHSE